MIEESNLMAEGLVKSRSFPDSDCIVVAVESSVLCSKQVRFPVTIRGGVRCAPCSKWVRCPFTLMAECNVYYVVSKNAFQLLSVAEGDAYYVVSEYAD